ncbi:phage tail protein (plasmid) [Leptospira sp. WS92.C1]
MRVNLPLEVKQNESTVIRLKGLKNIFDPIAQIIFQVKENSSSLKILISIEPLASDEGADWEHDEIIIRIPPAMTRGLKATVYEWDLLVNRQGNFEYPYFGTFTLLGTISRNNESVDPVVINDLETRLAGTTMGRGSWMIGVFSTYWLGKLGSIGNLVLEKCLQWLDQNKLGILNPYTGSKLLKSGSSALQISETGIEIDTEDNISGAKSLSLLIAPTLDAHATRRDWVIALVDAAILQAKADLIDGAPGVLDTLLEISEALNNDPNFANTIINSLSAKADLVSGKVPLSQLPALVATDWNDILNKPTEFNPASHNHDTRYYTQAQVDALIASIPSGSSGFDVGDIKESARSSPLIGWLLLNGQTIGNVGSGASNTGTNFQNLYILLWSDWPNAAIPIQDSSGVATSRGASALADWNLGKRLPLPNISGSSPMGAGNGPTLTARSLGDRIGEENHLLSISEIPAHNHGGGVHNHPVSTSNFSLTGGGISTKVGFSSVTKTNTDASAAIITTEGGGLGHNNIQPSLVLNFFIKY